MTDNWLRDNTFEGSGWRARYESMNLGPHGSNSLLTVWARDGAIEVRDHGRFAVIQIGDFLNAASIYLRPEHLESLREQLAALPTPERAS